VVKNLTKKKGEGLREDKERKYMRKIMGKKIKNRRTF
jgi:hypothetical protein